MLVTFFSCQAFGKVKPELEVGFTFWEMQVLVENPGKELESNGLTKARIESTVKKKLLGKGFKLVETSPSGSYLYVNVNELEPAFNVSLALRKFSGHYGISPYKGIGKVFTPGLQGDYTTIGKFSGRDHEYIFYALGKSMDDFIFDYLESNLKYELTRKDKELRGVDKVVYDAIEMVRTESKEDAGFWPRFPSHVQWWLRYYKLTGNQAQTHPSAKPREPNQVSGAVKDSVPFIPVKP